LNYLFGSIEEKQTKSQKSIKEIYSGNSDELEKKILSYANNTIYSYKTLFQHISNSKETKLEGINLKVYIIYINLSLVLNLIRKGYYSLGFTKLKYLLENEILMNSANYEIIDSIQNILVDMLDYDINDSLEYFLLFYKKNQNFCSINSSNLKQVFNNKNNSFDHMVKVIKLKFYSFSQNEIFIKNENFEADEDIKNNIFYSFTVEYILIFSEIKNLSYKSDINHIKINILKLKNFIKKAKQHKLFRLYFNAKLNLAKLYLFQDPNKACLIGIKLKDKNLDDSLLLKYYLFDCFLNAKIKDFKKLKKNLCFIENSYLLMNSGSIEDNYDFYFFKMEMLLFKLKEDLSKYLNLIELFCLWLHLLIIAVKMLNKEKIFYLLNLFIMNFELNIEALQRDVFSVIDYNDQTSKINDDSNDDQNTNVFSNLNYFADLDLKEIFHVFTNVNNKVKVLKMINDHLEFNERLLSFMENSIVETEEEIEIIYLINQNNENFPKKIRDVLKI